MVEDVVPSAATVNVPVPNMLVPNGAFRRPYNPVAAAQSANRCAVTQSELSQAQGAGRGAMSNGRFR